MVPVIDGPDMFLTFGVFRFQNHGILVLEPHSVLESIHVLHRSLPRSFPKTFIVLGMTH